MAYKHANVLIFILGLSVGMVIESHLGSVLQTNRKANNHPMLESSLSDSSVYKGAPETISQQRPLPPMPSGSPKIDVAETSYSFGQQDAGEVIEHSFILNNRGRGLLVIDKVSVGCGCTQANLSNYEILPGESTTLKVRLDLHNQRGSQHRTVVIRSNDPETPNLPLRLIGESVYHVNVDPPAARFVAASDENSKQYATTQILVRADRVVGDFKVVGVKTSDDHVMVDYKLNEDGKTYEVDVRLALKDIEDDYSGWARLITNHTGEYQEIYIPISRDSTRERSLLNKVNSTNSSIDSPTINTNIGDLFKIEGRTLAGKDVTAEEYKGKITAVIFWSSTCSACRDEILDIKQLYKDYSARGFEVVGVNLDRDIKKLGKYLLETNLPWENLIDFKDDTETPISRKYKVRSIPKVILLNKENKVVSIDKRGLVLRQLVDEMLDDPNTIKTSRSNKTSTTIYANKAAKLWVKNPIFDFGEANAGSIVKHQFMLENIGTDTLEILKIKPSCGCTTVEMPNKLIPPGKSTSLMVKLNLKVQRGDQDRKVLIETNDPDQPIAILRLIGEAIYHVNVQPRIANFSNIVAGSSKEITLRISPDETIPRISVVSTRTSNEEEISVISSRDETSGEIQAKISINPSLNRSGPFAGWVHLITDHPGEYHIIGIPVKSVVEPVNNDDAE